jgi:glycerophosphoryl diester phosphodiesterase
MSGLSENLPVPVKTCLLLAAIASCCLFSMTGCHNRNAGEFAKHDVPLPERGLCAHRGAMGTHPENTLPAFRAAVESGAHMIEFDVRLTKDGEIVVIHDESVDRTTDGSGLVARLTFEEIRQLDAGSWKSGAFSGVRVPSLNEVLAIMPMNIWLNIHIKGEDMLGALVAAELENQNRLHQAFLACGAGASSLARAAVPGIMICNMDRRENNTDYVRETIEMGADFIQLRGPVYQGFYGYTRILRENGIRINYFGTDDPDELKALFEYGVDFPLVDDIKRTINILPELGIPVTTHP